MVGGKLTTYRRMAEDAVDARRWPGRRCRPVRAARRALPLVGAAPRDALARVEAPARLVRRYGTEAPALLAARPRRSGSTTPTCSPRSPTASRPPPAELLWGVTHEGALDVDDLLDRRTRVGLVPADRARAEAAAAAAFATAAHAG